MNCLLILLALACPEPKMENLTSDPWNQQDYDHLKVAKKRCGEIYKASPCVILFRKRTTSDYSVICGKEKS